MNILPSIYQFQRASEKADEVKQGGNHYQGAVYQAVQYSYLPTVTSPLLDQIPNPQLRLIMKIFNQVVPVASWMLCPVAAAIKQGHYDLGVQIYNQITKKRFNFLSELPPKELSPQTVKTYNFISKHAGHIAQGGMVVGSVALAFLGSPYFAAAMAAQYTFKKMNQAGLFPKKISLLMEEKLPLLCDACLIFSGNIFNQVISGLTVLSSSQTINQYVQTKVDAFTNEKAGLEGPKLEEIDAPVQIEKNLPYKRIQFLLDLSFEDFTINPAHCSKAVDLSFLEQDWEYSFLLELSNQIDWTQKTSLLCKKFKDDERFHDYLTETFVELSKKEPTFEEYLQALMEMRKESLEILLSNQFKSQLQGLVAILKGDKPGQGTLADLEEARKHSRQIIAYLKKLNFKDHCLLIEDILLKLGIEAGEFCNRGIKRAASEIVQTILWEGSPTSDNGDLNYEIKLLQSLQFLRQNILDNTYLKFMEQLVLTVKNSGQPVYISAHSQTKDPHTVAFAQDIHTKDLYRISFALGFYPLLGYERNSFGLGDLVLWSHPAYPFRAMRNIMYQQYYQRLEEAFKEVGEIYFSDYLNRLINQNCFLAENEKKYLLERYLGLTEEKASMEEMVQKFKRLVLFSLGVLQLSQQGLAREEQHQQQEKKQAEIAECLSGWVEIN